METPARKATHTEPAELPKGDAISKPAQTVSTPPAAATPTEARKGFSIKKMVGLVIVIALVVCGVVYGIPAVRNALNTVSSDDAYVNGHFTLVAPRVASQVAEVLVDDNNRVKKADLLVRLDAEPFRVQLNIAQAAVDAAQADLSVAQAQARGAVGATRSLRFNLEHAIESVDNQVALLRAKAAALALEDAALSKALNDFNRALPLEKMGAVANEEIDHRRQALEVARAQREEALQEVNQVRVALGLPINDGSGKVKVTDVPADLDQTFSTVREAQASLMQSASQLGYIDSFNKTPKQMVADFYKQDPNGNIDKIYEKLLKQNPNVKQSEAKLEQAQRQLDDAKLNLRYCEIRSEIDGVVTRRSVNPGNHVVAGQSIMAVRSLKEIWIDANFKETQLADLKIGQPVNIDVDMYGKRQEFKGRISGFTMGTGSTLALLPAENATGNFVKVVQRLPVRIELVDYDPDRTPLFIGLSVTPVVRIHEQPTGPNAGKVLQPYIAVTEQLAEAQTTQTQRKNLL